ncbi:MAG: M20 family metallopeptidase [Actinomycetia bacterium]|nr:M20 family metallopeptidase [Actinomycetes bacterium]
MTQSPSDLLSAAQDVASEIVELRRDLHANPELGLQLPGTQKRILDALTGLGLDITLGESVTSVVADLDTGREGPTVLLRGDMDALPLTEDSDLPFKSTVEGRMHACGHDSHVAMLVGAAKLLSANKGELTGRVRFMFQPGEEGFHGARYMIEEGVLDGVDRAFAIHVDTSEPVGVVGCKGGAVLASSDELHITVTGRGGHASAPHIARDPIPAAAAMVGAFQTMVTREVDVFEPAVVTIAHIDSGTTNNIIPEIARMEGTIRTVSEATRALVHTSVERVASGIAEAYGCSCEVDIIKGYPVTVNDPAMAALVERAAGWVLGDGRHVTSEKPSMGAEDFSYVLQKVPGAMMGLGAGPAAIDANTEIYSLHSNRMLLNEDVLGSGIAMHAAMVMTPPE